MRSAVRFCRKVEENADAIGASRGSAVRGRTGLPGAADEAGAVLFKRLFVGYTLIRVSRERGRTVGMDSWSE